MSPVSLLNVERLDHLSVVLRKESRRVQLLHRHSLGHGHDPIGWVVEAGHWLTSIGEEGGHITHFALVHDSALVQQDEMVERIEDFGCRLMDGEQDRRAGIGHLFEGLDKLNGAE